MKYWLRHLPLEVWVDVFRYPWITRKEMSRIVDKIGNYKFAEYLQFYLHEWGKRTLGTLTFKKGYVCKLLFDETRMDIADTPMPENIKFFKRISIWHLDSSTIAFLRNISPLFNDVNLAFRFGQGCLTLTNLRTMLEHLSPLLHGIHSLTFMQCAIPLVEQYFTDKLAQIKLLDIYFIFDQLDQATIQASINFCLNWLTSERRDPAEPRILIVHIYRAANFQQFCMAIKQQFLSAKSPCTFAIRFNCYAYNSSQMANFHLENNMGEQLDGQFHEKAITFQIHRHKQVDFARTQLQEWANQTEDKSVKSSSGIELFSFATIGQIDANAGAHMDGEEVQQSTSG